MAKIDDETIRRLAYVIWQVKERQQISSTSKENWGEAEKTLSDNRKRICSYSLFSIRL